MEIPKDSGLFDEFRLTVKISINPDAIRKVISPNTKPLAPTCALPLLPISQVMAPPRTMISPTTYHDFAFDPASSVNNTINGMVLLMMCTQPA